MIAYDELCEALARYRTRNGMANGASASPPRQAAAPSPMTTTPSGGVRTASGPYAAAQRSPSGEYPASSSGGFPAAAAQSPSGGYPAVSMHSPPGGYPVAGGGFVPAATREDFAGPSADDRTDIHTPAAPREDPTGEIDIDAVDVVEEEDV